MKFYTSILFILFTIGMYAQQDSQFTQYMYNTSAINPGYAGSRDVLSINILHRSQWIGVPGAPTTQTLSAHGPVWRNQGIGISFIRDQIGPQAENHFAVDFSHRLRLNDRGTLLSFGIKGGVNLYQLDYSGLNVDDPTDDLLPDGTFRTSPLFGFGAYIYDKKWYLGISAPNVLSTSQSKTVSFSKVAENIHFYTIAGYVFQLNNTVKFKPATLLKITDGAPFSLDFSANFLFHEKFTAGLSYRLNAAFSGLIGLQASPQLMLGYAYDYDTTEFGRYNSGSHEFFLRYEFIEKVKGKINPRFF